MPDGQIVDRRGELADSLVGHQIRGVEDHRRLLPGQIRRLRRVEPRQDGESA